MYSLGSDADDPFALVTTTDTLKYIDHQLSQCIDKMDLLDAYRWILTRALALKVYCSKRIRVRMCSSVL